MGLCDDGKWQIPIPNLVVNKLISQLVATHQKLVEALLVTKLLTRCYLTIYPSKSVKLQHLRITLVSHRSCKYLVFSFVQLNVCSVT